jgi:ferredoxin-NADP reductase
VSPFVTTLDYVATDLDPSGAVAVQFSAFRSLRFAAGQHGLWLVPGGGAKPYTIASAPEEDVVTLTTDLSSGSRFKGALCALHDGSSVRFAGPVGGFTLKPDAREVVMLAQGIGITPFRSILRHTSLTGVDVRTTLVHVSARHPFQDDTAVKASTAHYPQSREAFIDRVTDVTRAHPQG